MDARHTPHLHLSRLDWHTHAHRSLATSYTTQPHPHQPLATPHPRCHAALTPTHQCTFTHATCVRLHRDLHLVNCCATLAPGWFVIGKFPPLARPTGNLLTSPRSTLLLGIPFSLKMMTPFGTRCAPVSRWQHPHSARVFRRLETTPPPRRPHQHHPGHSTPLRFDPTPQDPPVSRPPTRLSSHLPSVPGGTLPRHHPLRL